VLRKSLCVFLTVCMTGLAPLFAKDLSRQMSDDQLIEMLDTSLKSLPDKISKLDPKIRRIAFYSLKVDRANISLPLFRQIYGKIEASFLKVPRPILIYAPEIKPMKVISNENSISFVSGFQSTDEIKAISDKLRLDGFLEGELYITDRTLYLNLRIFEAETMAVSWSEELTSITPPPLPAPKLTGLDYGVGLVGIPLSTTAESASMNIPTYAQYYSLDMKISQKTLNGDKARFTLDGGMLARYDALNGNGISDTIISGSGYGVYFFTKFGLRISLIPAAGIDPARDWLSTNITVGRLFGLGTSGVTTFGVDFETDLTKNISMGAGVNFVPLTEVNVGSGQTVKAGGLAYEISLLRLNYKP